MVFRLGVYSEVILHSNTETGEMVVGESEGGIATAQSNLKGLLITKFMFI
jgi:hypothetical protein